MDNSLYWKGHLKTVSANVPKAIDLLRHAKTFLSQATLITLYTAIVEPHFSILLLCLGLRKFN